MIKKRQPWIIGLFLLAFLLQITAAAALQAAEVNVYAFKAGVLQTQTQYILKDTRIGTPLNVPVPFFLIKHGQDWVAFDTGMNVKVVDDAVGHWGEGIVKAYTPVMTREEEFKAQIKKAFGLTPKDLKAVIVSHGHLDHAGSIGNFKGTNVPLYFQKIEMDEVRKIVDAKKAGTAYPLGDYEFLSELNIKEIDGVYDVFGDKTVVAFPVPGHTPGQQALYIKPSKGKPFIITSDAMYTLENMEKNIPPGLAWDIPLTQLNVSYFRLFALVANTIIVPMHDDGYWENKDVAPKEFKP
ncbi:MAG: N-acyl homoserine lactonase family protein [Pseudomonadota bacterium]